MNIVLSGFMGSGKTTLAKTMSEMLNMDYIDFDEYIAEQSGMNISQIFEYYGEQKFRDLEHDAAIKIGQRDNCIVATGGGTILDSDNVAALKKGGVIVFLDVSVETVLRRLAADESRPMIKNDKENAVAEMLKGRLPLYLAQADIRFDANSDDTEKKANSLIKLLKAEAKL